jgi:hypothetical protein
MGGAPPILAVVSERTPGLCGAGQQETGTRHEASAVGLFRKTGTMNVILVEKKAYLFRKTGIYRQGVGV